MTQLNSTGIDSDLLAVRLLECSTIGGAAEADPLRKMALRGFVGSLTLDQQLLLSVLVGDIEKNITAYRGSVTQLTSDLKDWNDDAVAVLGSQAQVRAHSHVSPPAAPVVIAPNPATPGLDPAAEAALRTAQIRAELAQRAGKSGGDVDSIYRAAYQAAETVGAVTAAHSLVHLPNAAESLLAAGEPVAFPVSPPRHRGGRQRTVAVHADGTVQEVGSVSEAYQALDARQ